MYQFYLVKTIHQFLIYLHVAVSTLSTFTALYFHLVEVNYNFMDIQDVYYEGFDQVLKEKRRVNCILCGVSLL